MDSQIHFRAEVTIEEGKIEEYKKVVQRFEQSSESYQARYNKLPGTLMELRQSVL